MTVYHIYVMRGGEEGWIAVGLLNNEQAQLVGHALRDITRIETWLGDSVYERVTVH